LDDGTVPVFDIGGISDTMEKTNVGKCRYIALISRCKQIL